MWLALCSIKSNNVTFLIRSTTSQSSSYPMVLMRLGEPCSRPDPHLKLWKCSESNLWPHNQKSDMLTTRPMRRSSLPVWEIIFHLPSEAGAFMVQEQHPPSQAISWILNQVLSKKYAFEACPQFNKSEYTAVPPH